MSRVWDGLSWKKIYIKYRYHIIKENLVMWIAWHLPRYLVMWCYVRIATYALAGKYSNTDISTLTVMEALSRWDKQ